MDLIRHAKTQWNLEKRLQGRQDIPLSTQGIRDANVWAERLKHHLYHHIISSPMIRARETAQIISERLNVPVSFELNLREQDFGVWEGKTLPALRKNFPGLVEIQEDRGWAFCPPGGESRQQVLNRLLPAIMKMEHAYKGKHLLVVTHSSVMKILIYYILGRQFLAFERPKSRDLLKAWYLHKLVWNDSLAKIEIETLNAMDLSSK